MPFDGLEGYKEALQRKPDGWKLLSEDEDTLCYYLNEQKLFTDGNGKRFQRGMRSK